MKCGKSTNQIDYLIELRENYCFYRLVTSNQHKSIHSTQTKGEKCSQFSETHTKWASALRHTTILCNNSMKSFLVSSHSPLTLFPHFLAFYDQMTRNGIVTEPQPKKQQHQKRLQNNRFFISDIFVLCKRCGV